MITNSHTYFHLLTPVGCYLMLYNFCVSTPTMKLEMAICSNQMRQSPIQSNNNQSCMWSHSHLPTYLSHILSSFHFWFYHTGGRGFTPWTPISSHPWGCWFFHPQNLCTRKSLSCCSGKKQGQSSSIDPTYSLTPSLPWPCPVYSFTYKLTPMIKGDLSLYRSFDGGFFHPSNLPMK